MVKIIFTLLFIVLLIFSGKIIYAAKKLLQLITDLLLKILSRFGLTIKRKENKVKTSSDFKNTYKEIKIVKLSKENLKETSSINWLYLSIFLICILFVVLNLSVVSGNVISNFLFNLNIVPLVSTAGDMNTFYTAFFFSLLSFSFGRVLDRWKETKQQRIESKNKKLKEEAIKLMSSKELLDNARKKSEDKYKELK